MQEGADGVSPFLNSVDTEEVEWINAVIEEVWPFASHALIVDVLRILKPAIRANLPPFIPPFVFTRVSLGATPPRVTSVSVRSHDDERDFRAAAKAAFAAAMATSLGVSIPPMYPAESAAASPPATASAIGEQQQRYRRRRHQFWTRSGPPRHVHDESGSSDSRERGNEDAGAQSFPATTSSFYDSDSDDSCASSIEMGAERALRQSGTHPPRSLVLELGISYAGNPTIEMALARSWNASRFGIDSLEMRGTIEVIIAPLLNRLPLFGGVRAAFINLPELEFTLTGLAAAGDVGPWTQSLRTIASDVCGAICVLPNYFAIRLDRRVDVFEMARIMRPFGVLRVAVLQGTGFPHTDENILKQTLGQSSEPDVYVRLRLGSVTHCTKRVDDCANPVFDREIFDFIIATKSPNQLLRIDAYDYDIGKDDRLGWAELHVGTLLRASGVRNVRMLNSPLGAIPRLQILAQYLPLSKATADVQAAMHAQYIDRTRPQTCSSLALVLWIDRASHLPPGGKTRPFVRVYIGNRQVLETWNAFEVEAEDSDSGKGYTQTTSTASIVEEEQQEREKERSQENPEWALAQHILVQDAVNGSTKVSFEVRDGAVVDGILGSAFMVLGDLLCRANCAKTYNFALRKATTARATLRVRVGLEAVMNAGAPPLWESIGELAEPMLTGGAEDVAPIIG